MLKNLDYVLQTSSISSIVLSTFSRVRPFCAHPDFKASAPILYDSRICQENKY